MNGARQFTLLSPCLISPLTPDNSVLGGNPWWTSIPSRGWKEILLVVWHERNQDKFWLYGPVAWCRHNLYLMLDEQWYWSKCLFNKCHWWLLPASHIQTNINFMVYEKLSCNKILLMFSFLESYLLKLRKNRKRFASILVAVNRKDIVVFITKKFGLNYLSSLFVIRVNLLHP